jgi:hypothetical protein
MCTVRNSNCCHASATLCKQTRGKCALLEIASDAIRATLCKQSGGKYALLEIASDAIRDTLSKQLSGKYAQLEIASATILALHCAHKRKGKTHC